MRSKNLVRILKIIFTRKANITVLIVLMVLCVSVQVKYVYTGLSADGSNAVLRYKSDISKLPNERQDQHTSCISTQGNEEFSQLIESLNKTCSGIACSKLYKRLLRAANVSENIAEKAYSVSLHSKKVLFTMINGNYLELAYSWFCNTKYFGIHKSLVVVTTDRKAYISIQKDWPDITPVLIDHEDMEGDQEYSRVGYLNIMVKRTLIILAVLMSDVELFLVEMDSVWFSNAVDAVQVNINVDMLVNPVVPGIYNGGLLYVVPTNKSKVLWMKLSAMMIDLSKVLENCNRSHQVPESDNDQVYFSQLVMKRHVQFCLVQMTYANNLFNLSIIKCP